MAKSNEGNNGEPKTNGKGGLTTLRSLFVGERSSNSANRKAVNGLASIHPFIAEILGGVEASGDQKEILPGSITIFVREGKVRFSANVKSADTTIIGEVSDPINVWDSITYALSSGEVSSKRYSERVSSSTEKQDPPY